MVATRPLADVRDDSRGAVMLTGLFMSCFLIGALWFIVGLGDTIVYRDRMQEATDHGAFASAALSAKGMNFISLCNLVLLVAITIHIVLGIIHDIALALCIVSIGTTCGYWQGIRQLYTNYFDVLKPAARAIHNAGKVGSYGFPVMGLAESLSVGKSYAGGKSGTPTVIALGPSMLSGASFSGTAGARKKQGLTIESQPMNLVCRRVASLGIDALFKTALGVSGRGFAGKVMDLAKKIVGNVLVLRYCNDMGSREQVSESERVSDYIEQGNEYAGKGGGGLVAGGGDLTGGGGGMGGLGGGGAGGGGATGGGASGGSGGIDPGFDSFWGEDGPLTVIGPAKNGNDWFQTYSVNLNPAMTDVSESHVGLGLGPKKSKGKYETKARPVGGFYLAQAEYFFDCDKKWSAEGCNFDANSTFAIKWRARIRRFSIPSFSNLLGTVGGALLRDVPQYDQYKKLQGQIDLGKDLFGSNGVTSMTKVNEYLGQAGKQAQDALTSQAKGAMGNLDVPFH